MATRFYLPSTGAAAVSPAPASGWDGNPADELAMVRTRISSSNTPAGYTTTLEEVPGGKYGIRRYVSEPVPAQTIAGTLKGQVRAREDSVTDNFDQVILGVRVVSNDGSTVRGTLLAVGSYGGTNEFSASGTFTNRKIADGDSLSSVAASANDRIVIELGVGITTTGLGFESAEELMFGDNSGDDLPEDETTTAANNPWIEFSQDIFLQTLTPSAVDAVGAVVLVGMIVAQAAVAGVGSGVGPAGYVIGTVAPEGLGGASGMNYVTGIFAAEGVAEVPYPEFADVVVDSYNNETPTVQVATALTVPKVVIRPTTPSELGDLTRLTQVDGGTIEGSASGDLLIVGTVFPVLTAYTGAISFVRMFAYVSTTDVSPVGGYVACTAPQMVVKLGTGTRGTYGLIAGSTPIDMGVDDQPIWQSDDMTFDGDSQPWTWATLATMTEMGVTAHYVLGGGEFTNLRLDEVWMEVWAPQGSFITPFTLTFKAGSFSLQLPTAGNLSN